MIPSRILKAIYLYMVFIYLILLNSVYQYQIAYIEMIQIFYFPFQ